MKEDKIQVSIGVDIGGSHISCAAINTATFETITSTYSSGPVASKADKHSIFEDWSQIINKTLEKVKYEDILGIGIAMPGPFDYNKGMGLFQGNDKYEALYQVSVATELPQFLSNKNLNLRFINDASSFAIGSALKEKITSRVLAITLGTGFGAAFLENRIPLSPGEDVPEDGCLWDKPYKDGIADDFFSTRWFAKRYLEMTGTTVSGVKDIVDANDQYGIAVFTEFSRNLNEFLLPYLEKFKPDLLFMGGNIAKAQHLFLPELERVWRANGLKIPVSLVESTEEASILGSSYLFEPYFFCEK